MKKTFRNLLSLVLCVAMLLSLVSTLGITAAAAGEVTEVTTTVEFSSLAENTSDKTAAAESIKSVGVYDVNNMQIQKTFDMCVTPGGYAGEGYIVVKLDAGEGNVFMTAPVVDLTYWLAVNADAQGYINVTGGIDGTNYPITFYSQTTGLGTDYSEDARQYQSISLNGAQGFQTVYVKITVQHWGSMYCGAIQQVTVTGQAVSSETYASHTASNTLDFSSMSASSTDDFATAANVITGLGAEAAENLVIADCHTKFVAGKGYAGEGYYIQTLDLGEGNTFAAAPIVELTYWLATNTDGQGYVKVQGSVDGTNYYDFANFNTGKGAEYDLVSREDAAVVLNGAQGYQKVWVKIIIQHWGGATCGGVVKSTITGTSANELSGGSQPPASNLASVTVDLTAQPETEDKTAAAELIKSAGAYDVSNLKLQNTFNGTATPGGYAGEGYIIVKLDAGEGKVFASDPVVDLTYWLADVDGKGYVKVQGSLDNETYYDFWSDETGSGENYSETAKHNAQITLTPVAGSSTVYAKVIVQHWGSPYCGAIEKITISADVKADSVSATLDVTAQPETEDKTAAAELIKSAGAYEVSNLKLQNTYNGTATPGGYAGEGYVVVKLDAGEGKVFANDPVVDLTYWLADVDGKGYVKVQGSTDNATYTDFWSDETGAGENYSETAKHTAKVTLTSLAGSSTVYAKVLVQHWGSPYCGAIEKVTISADVMDDPNPGEEDAPVSATVDVSAQPETADKTAAAELIKSAGAYEVSNLQLQNTFNGTATPGGYAGEGYIIVKLDAGAGKMFASDPVVDLTYWLANVEGKGYVKVQASTNNAVYTDFWSDETGDGENYSETAKHNAQITLTSLAGSSTVYVKVIVQHWGSPYCGAIEKITVSADVMDDPDANISNVLDFSDLTATTEDFSAAASAITDLGAVEAGNLIISDIFSKFVAGRGYAGEGYFVQKLTAGAGKVFAAAPVLKLDYRVATNAENQGYVKVEMSLDGETYTQVALYNEGLGDNYTQDCFGSASIELTAAAGYRDVYVKVSMQHWSAPDGAGVDYSGLTATTVNGAPPVDMEEPTGNYSSEIDFSALAKDENSATAIETILGKGAYAASNLYLGGNNSVVATPGGNMGEGYVVLKVWAADNAALENIALNIKYWAYNADTSVDPGYLTISVSLDGVNFTDVKTITGSSSLTTVQDYTHKLTSLYGATTAYVKVTMQHWESYEGAALEYIGLTSTPNNMKGDINSDTMLSGLDVEYLRGAVLGGKRKDAAQQDMNADGAVNVCDVVARMRYEGANYSEAAVDSEYVMNFGDVTLYGENPNTTENSDVTTTGTFVNAGAVGAVSGGAGDYANETYGYVELDTRNEYLQFTMPVPTTGTVTLDIEEIHERNDAKFNYTVKVNGTTVGSTRSYDPNSTGPNHHLVDVPASVQDGTGKMTVLITKTGYGTQGNVRIRRVWALPDVDILASAQGVATKMKLGIMLGEAPTAKTIEQLKSLVESYKAEGVYEVALCWEMNYMIWGEEGTKSQINHVLDAAAEIGAPLYLGISSWWGGTPIDGMDGEGGSWSDPKYSQVSSYVNSGEYSLTTPNEFSDTPWKTMNNDNYNKVRVERIKETLAYIQRRSAELTMNGTTLPTVHLYTENEPYYWPLKWAVGDNDGEYGDFNPATVADAKADGVTLNPDDGLSDTELDWLYANLHTYISEVGEAFMDGAGTNYITVENGKITYPQQLLTDKSYTHTMLSTSLYTGHDINERAWENHILNTIHMGGEYNDVLDATRDSQPSGSMDNMIEDLRALQYMASYGSHANVNCEYIGMDDGFGIIPQYYAYGVDGTVIYNITNTQDDFDLVKEEASCGSETVSGTGYTRTQLRTRYQMVAARADVERLLARYATQDGTYTRATELYAQARYGEALKLLSAALSTQLTEDSAVDFMVKGYGTLGDFPLYVETANKAMAAIRVLAVADDYVKFELMESDAKSVHISLLNASGNYVLNNVGVNTWEITKAETGTAAADARVTFTVTYQDTCPKTVIGEIREKGDTYLIIRTEDEAVGGYSYFRTFGWTGGNKSNVTVTRTAFGASTTSATVDDLQPGDYVCVQLDDDYNIKNVEAQYLTVTGTINSITTTTVSKEAITNPIINLYIPAYGASFNIEVGGDTKLIYGGSTTRLCNYDATSTFGLSKGDTITVSVSLYNLWYYGGHGNRTDGCYRAQSITK